MTRLKIILWLIFLPPVGVFLLVKHLFKKTTQNESFKDEQKRILEIDSKKNSQDSDKKIKEDPITSAKMDEQNTNNQKIPHEFRELYGEFEGLKIGTEEKVCLLVGFVALFGDGKFSDIEIQKLREFLIEMKFSPSTLIHKDPSDQNLCLDEKLAWVLEKIRNIFQNVDSMQHEEMFDWFKVCSISLQNELGKSKSKTEQKQYLMHVKSLLTEIAQVDGDVSLQEKELIKTFSSVTMPSFASRFAKF
jgi:hypothetical protein